MSTSARPIQKLVDNLQHPSSQTKKQEPQPPTDKPKAENHKTAAPQRATPPPTGVPLFFSCFFSCHFSSRPTIQSRSRLPSPLFGCVSVHSIFTVVPSGPCVLCLLSKCFNRPAVFMIASSLPTALGRGTSQSQSDEAYRTYAKSLILLLSIKKSGF